MRARALEIAWHESTSVWALDAAESGGVTRLVTAGGDKMARVWRLRNRTAPCTSATKPSLDDNGPTSGGRAPETEVDAEWVCDLRAHSSTVNVARFAPSGAALATAADGGEIVIWALEAGDSGASASPAFGGGGEERWGHAHTLRGHTHDVLDMAWAPCGTVLASASVDNAVLVWRVGAASKPRAPVALRHAANFVQGVAFSPDGALLASLGNDRLLRVFARRRPDASRWDLIATVGSVGVQRLFVDDFNSKNVFRRLAWSPDGNLLACPSGVDVLAEGKKSFAVHLFARTSLLAPLLQCGGLPRPAISVRFCPVLFTLRKRKRKVEPPSEAVPMEVEPADSTATQNAANVGNHVQFAQPLSMPVHNTNGPSCPVSQSPAPPPTTVAPVPPSEERSTASDSMEDHQKPLSVLPYRMVFAVACTDAIFVYDTEALGRPIARISGLHLAEHTDLSWTPDGRSLFISSTDGYVSCVSFSAGEIGTPLPKSAYPVLHAAPQPPAQSISKAQPDAQPMCVVPQRAQAPSTKTAVQGGGGDPAAFVSRNGLSSRVSASLALGALEKTQSASTMAPAIAPSAGTGQAISPAVLRKRQFLQADLAAAQRRAPSLQAPIPMNTSMEGNKKDEKMTKASIGSAGPTALIAPTAPTAPTAPAAPVAEPPLRATTVIQAEQKAQSEKGVGKTSGAVQVEREQPNRR